MPAGLTILWAVLIVFVTATLLLAAYGLHLYVLLLLFKRRSRGRRSRQLEVIDAYGRGRSDEDWPVVTSQIPIYNEVHVAQRVIEAVAAISYPAGRHEVQVLDDSTDRTREVVDVCVERLTAKGVNVYVVRRANRAGYKAGALAAGVAEARGTYVAVFDSDFVPPRDFLCKAVPLLEEADDLACIQGRWEHLNRGQSWLTEAQALGIDGHFAIEQGARAWNGLMMNFNGTAGVWRKSAIVDAKVGGWSGDTLTEDLDLSYRVQLAGWRLDYCLDMPCPAELPGSIEALKSQQRRWATGSIQVARKLLPRIWRSDATVGQKLEATLHLTHYSVAVWMLVLALVARPMLVIYAEGTVFSREWLWLAWTIILLSAFAPSLVYTYARYSLGGGLSGLTRIPSMLILGCGLCVNNSLAVMRGFFQRGGEFVRTPKAGTARVCTYRVSQNHAWIAELLLGLYSLTTFVYCVGRQHRAFSFFLLIYAVGFLTVGWMSRPKRRATMRGMVIEMPSLSGANP